MACQPASAGSMSMIRVVLYNKLWMKGWSGKPHKWQQDRDSCVPVTGT